MNKPDYIEIGRRIRQCREEHGFSHEKVAELCHISPSFYCNIERGSKIMSLETFVSICQALSVSSDYLLNNILPETDASALHVISEAKKYGDIQYKKYIHLVKALVNITDQL